MRRPAKLVVDGTTLEVNCDSLIRGCRLFADNPILVQTPYVVRSRCSLAVVEAFIGFVEGGKVKITSENVSGLWQLSEEFGFSCLLKDFLSLGKGNDENVRERLLAHDDELSKHERRLAALESRIRSLSRQPSTRTSEPPFDIDSVV
jgi:hypothetical protein